MRIYDISRDIMSTPVYPGDPVPKQTRVMKLENGELCNLSVIEMCAHNATHVDAPNHFIEDGYTIEDIPMTNCVGHCTIAEFNEPITGEQIEKLLKTSKKRIIFKGTGELTQSAAFALATGGVKLVGVENQSVGDEKIHLELLGAEITLLEGLALSKVDAGDYYLVAAPIKMAGLEGAPCRAILLEGIIA